MSHLLNYLNTHFKTPEGIEEHFLQNFGVNVKTEDGFFLFKYDMIAVKWNDPLVFECRGCILKIVEGSWKFFSRPFGKFFNISEGHCPIFSDKEFEEKLPSLYMREKMDGTCIQVWHDGTRWRFSTLGTINTLPLNGTSYTFEAIFNKGINDKFYQILSKISEEYTFIFELISPLNRIVTDYGNSIQVCPLAARSRISGWIVNSDRLDELTEGIIDNNWPESVVLTNVGIKTKTELIQYVENSLEDQEKYGKNPEGWVVYLGSVPVAKVKKSKYLALHRFSGGDPLSSRNSLIDLFLAGGIDDVYNDLIPMMQEFCDRMSEWARNVGVQIAEVAKKVHEKQPQTQKDYAMLVKDSPFSAFMFQNKDRVLSGEVVPSDYFMWIKVNKPKGIEEHLKKLWQGSVLTTLD